MRGEDIKHLIMMQNAILFLPDEYFLHLWLRKIQDQSIKGIKKKKKLNKIYF